MLKLTVNCRADDNGCPICALVNIDEAAMTRIQLFSAFVKKNGLYRVERFDLSPTWYNVDVDVSDPLLESLQAETASVECVCLNVSADCFWWSAFLKNSDIEIETEKVPIQPYQEKRVA